MKTVAKVAEVRGAIKALVGESPFSVETVLSLPCFPEKDRPYVEAVIALTALRLDGGMAVFVGE